MLKSIDEERANALCKSEGCKNKVIPPRYRKGPKGVWINYTTRCRSCQHNMYAYKITTPERDNLLSEQDGRCAICSDQVVFGFNAHVDHCHSTGVIRGILCSKCNQGIGLFMDNLRRLYGAIQYLERQQC